MKYNKLRKALILLADGTIFHGKSVGNKEGTAFGEVCFNTGMTGYQEIFTDPSYFGQLMVATNAHIGNYGVNNEEVESDSIKIAGLICKNFSYEYSRVDADGSLEDFFNKNNHAKGYQKNNSFLNWIMGFFIDKSRFMDTPEGLWKPFKNYYVNGTAYGGLIGTPLAFVKYIQELLQSHSKLLNSQSIKMLFTENLTLNGKGSGMGLSWFSGNLNSFRYFAHSGGGGGYYCEIRIYPELKMGSVIMFNRTGTTNERFLDKLDRYYIKIY